ncbi:uncharacterized protein EDB93DRAFT_1236976 [Suillus bovinus]|uniref:uncharacterized protein n=1 Tax=Suillus bovinus TaxID=48563 RepID=UPI001B8841BB|nr:uncharacterized protein EDB93DRAFT_1236976 [Suillus bovinus]KAG2159668.1 hypothetical protein EDB93DRAFT_1236976 [Suillus bovinus]
MNICKCAIASFFEWDKLDRAVGGTQQALGTKLHQHTHKAIAKRQPALMTAIQKFNTYCEQLEFLYDPSWGIPLPAPLPTKLTELRSDPRLMEDVWITPSVGEVPQWLEDSNVRDGIRALLKWDQCEEEQIRLSIEADNLCLFFSDELSALELALRLPDRDQANKALDIATTLSGASRSTTLLSINAESLTAPDPEGGDEFPVADPDHPMAINSEQAALADVLEGQMGVLELGDEDDDNDSTDYARGANVIIHWDLPEIFDPKDIGFLSSPTARLNDVCINSCTILLWHSQLTTSGAQCAILSTHNLPRIHYNVPDDVIWRNSSWVCYWEKDIWVLPIHHPSGIGHWVLCVIWLSNKELHLFDSLGNRQPWQNDVKVGSIFVLCI